MYKVIWISKGTKKEKTFTERNAAIVQAGWLETKGLKVFIQDLRAV